MTYNHVCLLLKPNISVPYSGAATHSGAADAANGASGTINTSTITIGASENISSIVSGNNGISCGWIVVGSNLWRILSISGQVMTIEGTIPATFTNQAWNVYTSVPIFVRWTDPSTITYVKLEFNSSTPDWSPKVDIKRYANRGATPIALGKMEALRAFKNMFTGPLNFSETATETAAAQLSRGLNYLMTEWPKTTPKYCNLYWYNGYTRNAARDWWSTASTFRMERGIINKISLNEDFVNNLMIDTLGMDLV